jgi:hypothetical protein
MADRIWIDVPNGAVIVLSLEVPPGMIVSGHVECIPSGGAQTEIVDAELRPGPARRTMPAPPPGYTYIARLTFAQPCIAIFRAHIQKVDGSRHGQPLEIAATGAAGEVKLAAIVCVMAP